MKKLIFLSAFFLTASLLPAQDNVNFIARKTYPFATSSIWGYTDTIKNKEYALVGTYNGLSIVDITNAPAITEVDSVPGTHGSWREIKTYSHYAYVSQDNAIDTSSSEGIMIVDLQFLPDSVKYYSWKGDSAARNYKSHTLFIDEKGFLYLNGGRTRIHGSMQNGTSIYNLKPDPLLPQFTGYTPSPEGTSLNYTHDCYSRNDLLFESNIWAGKLRIYNIADRANPTLITYINTPTSFTHNSWLSDDSKIVYTTDEVAFAPIGAFDISDLNNIKALPVFKDSPGDSAIPHNVHVLNDYIIVPYYTNGVQIFDASIPDNVIRIGFYDTYPAAWVSGFPFHGVWGAYPYFKTQKLVVSDIENGLFVLQPTYIRAARIQGIITDSTTSLPVVGATFSFGDTSISATSTVDGIYKTGTPRAGIFNFKVEKAGYVTKYFSATLVNGKIDTVNIQLSAVSTGIRNSISEIEMKFGSDQHELNIVNHSGSDIKELYIYNSIGAQVMLSEHPQNSLYLPSLPKDIYILRAISDNGRQHIGKIIIY